VQCIFPVDFVVFDVPGSVRREKKAGTGRRRPVVAVGLELERLGAKTLQSGCFVKRFGCKPSGGSHRSSREERGQGAIPTSPLHN